MSAERRASSSEPIRLLLIDDSRDDRHLLCDLLDEVADATFAIDWARDLSTGRDLLGHGDFDICLLDHELPDGDGLSLIETAIIRGIETPVIVLASHGSAEQDRRAMAFGASGFLDKSRLDSTLLERTIRYAIHQQNVVRDLGEAILRDDATGLITPVLFQDRLTRALTAAKRHQTMVALVLLDLGHDLASAELQERHLIDQAKRLTDQLRETDTVARLADHQLALILEGLRRPDDAALVTRKVLDRLAAPTDQGDGELSEAPRAGPFAGIALYPEDCCDISSMRRQAEAALRRAKSEKRKGYLFGAEHADQHVQREFLLSDDLKKALDLKTLALRYRPLIHVAEKAIGLSAEIDSNRLGRQPFSIDDFLPIADDQALIEALTDWLIGEAVFQLQTWQDQGFEKVSLSLPFISVRVVDLPILERSIRRHLKDASIAPGQLEIDLDQKLVIADLECGGHGLAALKAIGIRLAIDEFGRTDTCFHKLAHDRLDGLKLSSKLYHDLPGNAASETLLRAIINLGHDLDLQVVANGARDERQFAFLKRAGCDVIKLCAAESLLTADMFTTWLQKTDAPIRSERTGLTARTSVHSSAEQPELAVMKMDVKESLSPIDTL